MLSFQRFSQDWNGKFSMWRKNMFHSVDAVIGGRLNEGLFLHKNLIDYFLPAAVLSIIFFSSALFKREKSDCMAEIKQSISCNFPVITVFNRQFERQRHKRAYKKWAARFVYRYRVDFHKLLPFNLIAIYTAHINLASNNNIRSNVDDVTFRFAQNARKKAEFSNLENCVSKQENK